jgi:hypothetical protein
MTTRKIIDIFPYLDCMIQINRHTSPYTNYYVAEVFKNDSIGNIYCIEHTDKKKLLQEIKEWTKLNLVKEIMDS